MSSTPMRRRCFRTWNLAFLPAILLLGCSKEEPPPVGPSSVRREEKPSLEQVRAADVSILFIGNSHIGDLPHIVSEMIRFRHPEKSVVSHHVGVGFLEDVARYPTAKEELESRPWKYVVLQAQKESKTGQFKYSTAEGIDFAKRAKSRAATVIFYSEWGLRDVPGHGPRIEAVYREMAAASVATVARVGRAWDLALAERPDLPLYSPDGNHASKLGAFVTACVLTGRILDESPAPLASFPYAEGSDAVRRLLADCAAKAFAEPAGK